MQINITDLFMHKSENVTINRELSQDTLELEQVNYQATTPINVSLVMSQLDMETYLIKGLIEVQLKISCDRCTEDVLTDIKVDINKALKIGTNQLVDEDTQEYLVDEIFDLEKLVLDEIYMNLPVKTLCDEDCLGLCPSCGVNLNKATCKCENVNIDPRWAGLKDLFKD